MYMSPTRRPRGTRDSGFDDPRPPGAKEVRYSRSGRRPTMDDVAARAGVARGTVSRVVNESGLVSPQTRDAVHEAIRETGYVVNHHARSLVTHRSESVVFTLSARQEPLFEDPQFAVLLRGCVHALAEQGITLVLTVAGSTYRPDIMEFAAAGYVDGALVISSHSVEPIVAQLTTSGVPVVACGRPFSDDGDRIFVTADDRRGARDMVRHLRGRGRQRIATITAPLDTSAGVDRLAGYCDGLGGEVDSALIATGDYTRVGGHAAMNDLLTRAPDLDAVFAASGEAAFGAMQALRAAGRHIPRDVAVGGFDESDAAAATQPALTTVRSPMRRISVEMVRLLLEVLDGHHPSPLVLPTELVVRDST